MIANNIYTNRAELILETDQGTTNIYKYSYDDYISDTDAKANNLIGCLDDTRRATGKLPISHLLRHRLTNNCGEISLAGTTMVTEGVNRQDYINSLRASGNLSNNILYLKHEFDNAYDPLAISVRTEDMMGNELNLGYLPRYRPNRKTSNFGEDSGEVSNLQKLVAIDQEQNIKDQQYIISSYKVLGGYSGKHYGLMIYLGKKKPLPINLMSN